MGEKRRGFGSVFTRDGREGRYYVRYTDWRTGRRRDRYGGRTKKQAEALLGDLERRAWEERHLGRSRIVEQSLGAFLPTLLAHLEAVLAPGTYRVARAHLTEIAEHFGDIPMSRITKADVRAWVAKVRGEPRGRWKRRGEKIAPLTLDRMAGNARRAWNLAAESHIVPEGANPWRGLSLPKVHQRSVPYVSPGSLLRLYAAAGDLPAVVLVGETGLRRGELYRLQWSDFAPDIGNPSTITVRRSKSGKPRTIPLSDRAKKAIGSLGKGGQSFRDCLPSPGWLYRQLRAAGRRAGLGDRVGVHTLRHAFATGLADAGVPITRAAALLGHASVTVTQRYYAHLPEYAGEHAIKLLEALKARAGGADGE